MGRRTFVERRIARMGISLRDGVISSKTKELYASALVRLWAWARRSPPDTIHSVEIYYKFLAGVIEQSWTRGTARGEAGNALSASLHMYPQLRGNGRLVDSWYLLNAWSRYAIPMRAPPMPDQVTVALGVLFEWITWEWPF